MKFIPSISALPAAVFLMCSLLTYATGPSKTPIDVEFKGVIDLGGKPVFSLSSNEAGETAWVAEGDVFAGFEVVGFRASEKVLILRKAGEEFAVSLGAARVRPRAIDPEIATVHVSMLRQVGHASLIYANDNEENLPGPEAVTIHDVARLLARGGVLNSATVWITEGDARSGMEDRLTTVLKDRGPDLDPAFADQNVIAFDYATGLNTRMPSTTPVAWTRGLREDGTWDDGGPFGSAGGAIVFMGGNVRFYSDLKEEGGMLVQNSGRRTSNILEALPPGARVVGSGPGTLHGSTGLRGELNPE